MLKKLGLILEVVILFIGGAFLAIQIGKWTGLDAWLSESDQIISRNPVDFMALSGRAMVGYLIKYGTIFTILFAFLRLSRSKYQWRSLGLSRNKLSTGKMMKAAILTLCVAGIIPKVLMGIWPSGSIGEGPSGWQLFNQEWDSGFWLFMLITSFGTPPLVEEVYFRGYAQSRLASKFSPGASIWIVALIFALFHTQYLVASTITVLMAVSLLGGALAFSYTRHYTGSILPGIIAHVLVNIPVNGDYSYVVAGLMLMILIIYYKTLVRHLQHFLALTSFRSSS